MITADTITDEQIRELREQVRGRDPDMHVTGLCKEALREYECRACIHRASRGFEGQCPSCAHARSFARRRCAEILNAREPTLTDEQIESTLESALAGEDIELVDLCETALKTIIQPNLKRQAIARIAELLAARKGGAVMCDDNRDHDALKLDASAWSQLPYVGLQKTYDEPGKPTHMELRKCSCGSTLCLPVTREAQP